MSAIEIKMSIDLLMFILSERECENFTSGNCVTNGRHPLAKYGADQMCVPCMAALALSNEPEE